MHTYYINTHNAMPTHTPTSLALFHFRKRAIFFTGTSRMSLQGQIVKYSYLYWDTHTTYRAQLGWSLQNSRRPVGFSTSLMMGGSHVTWLSPKAKFHFLPWLLDKFILLNQVTEAVQAIWRHPAVTALTSFCFPDCGSGNDISLG